MVSVSWAERTARTGRYHTETGCIGACAAAVRLSRLRSLWAAQTTPSAKPLLSLAPDTLGSLWQPAALAWERPHLLCTISFGESPA